MASDCGRFVHIADGALRMTSLGGDGAEPIRLVVGESLLETQVEINAETMRRSTLARGWDVGSTAMVESLVSVAAQDAVELRGDDLNRFSGLGDRLLVNRLSGNPAEAEGLAQADMDRATALGATLIATAEGDPALRPGRTVSIEGVSDDGDGAYVLTEAVHAFDDSTGYTTRISTVPPPRPARSRRGLGDLRESDRRRRSGRARPGPRHARRLCEIESGWMPVLIVGAGAGKGLSVLPEPDDDVLVLLPDGDPARGIVLGGLYGVRQPPGERPDQGARTFTLRTPGGQSLTLDSVEASIRLETSAGDLLEMTPKGSRLSVTRDLLVEAPGHRLTFRAAHVDFERL